MTWEFKCLRCGNCCRNITKNGEFGLMLFPDETKYFPTSKIYPCIGKGKHSNHSSFQILTYQIPDDVCPHLNNNGCSIYMDRPLACKKYPIKVDSFIEGRISINPCCSALIKAKESGDFVEGMLLSQNSQEVVYAIQAGNWMLQHKKHHSRKDTLWIFNMKNKKWIPNK